MKYKVLVPIVGHIEVEAIADSEEKAIDLAFDHVEQKDLKLNFKSHPSSNPKLNGAIVTLDLQDESHPTITKIE